MRAFTMNLLSYSPNGQFPLFQAAPNPLATKHGLLRQELSIYNPMGAPVNVAGFTEVFVTDNALRVNVEGALNDLGDQLQIPLMLGNRYISVIRCGFSALQPNGSEVVAIVLDGNATNVCYYVSWFVPGYGDFFTPLRPMAGNYYVAHLQRIAGWAADYRYIVGVMFRLNGRNYNVAFFHNRQPGAIENMVAMGRARLLLGRRGNETMLLGGDFNTAPDCLILPACVAGHGRNRRAYYSINANTTTANNFDWWMSNTILRNQLVDAQCDATPTVPPGRLVTGSDHRGVGIEIT